VALFFILWIDYSFAANSDRQLLTSVKALTFNKGKMTSGRRSSPLPQLSCVGGSASGSNYQPSVVQCVNVGDDGFNVEWECKADLDDAVRFGSINVNCEGYDHPDDPYILKGSCSLEYNLEYTSKGANSNYNSFGGRSNNYYDENSSSSGWGSIFTFIVLVFVIYNIFRACANSQAAAYQAPAGGPGYGGPGFGGPGYGGPGYGSGYGGPGYGPGCAPTYTAPGFGGGGFWSGLATGGLLSHLFRPNYGYSRPWGGRTYGGGGSGFFGSSGGGGFGGGGSRMGSGFGGSSRR